MPRYVGVRLGRVRDVEGKDELTIEVSMEAMPCVLFDALVDPGRHRSSRNTGKHRSCAGFRQDQYRHCKPILALGAGADLVENAGVPAKLLNGENDPGSS